MFSVFLCEKAHCYLWFYIIYLFSDWHIYIFYPKVLQATLHRPNLTAPSPSCFTSKVQIHHRLVFLGLGFHSNSTLLDRSDSFHRLYSIFVYLDFTQPFFYYYFLSHFLRNGSSVLLLYSLCQFDKGVVPTALQMACLCMPSVKKGVQITIAV